MSKIKVSEREAKIIEILVKNQEVSADDLSTILSVSSRTLRSDVKQINELFVSEVIASSHNGYRIIDKSIITKIDVENYNRTNLMVRTLLEQDHPVDIDEFAEDNYVSKTTLINTLKSINLSAYNLEIKRESNQLFVYGSEYSKRRLIKKLLFDEIQPLFMDLSALNDYFNSIDVNDISSTVLTAVDKYNLIIENSYQLNLILNVVIAFDRIAQGFHAENTPGMNEGFLEYKIAKEICDTIGKKNNLTITDNDINALSNLFVGQFKHKLLHEIMGQLEDTIISESFKNKCTTILKIAFNHYMLNVDITPFKNSFITHCDQLVRRARANNLVSNSLEKSVKYNFPFIYDIAVYIGKQLEYEFDIKINDSEIAYIAIHIGYAIENTERKDSSVSIVILSNDYMNIRSNLMEKITKDFGDKINIQNVAVNISQLGNLENCDLLVTTEYIPMLLENVVNISYLYGLEDYKKLSNAIDKILHKKQNEHFKQELLSCFSDSLFFIDSDENFEDKNDVIQYLGNKVIEYGIEEDGYIESILERENLSSTLFAESFAIPHPMSMSAKKTIFTVLLSKKGIQWDDTVIHAVFLAAVKKGTSKDFMNIYNHFSKILIDEYKLAKLSSSTEFEQFFWRLSRMLEEE